MEERLGGKQDDEAKRNELAEHFGDDLMFATNFDNAIIGVSMGISCGTKVVYDAEEMAKTLVVSEGITEQEAWEYLEFNTFNAYVGENTPIFVSTSLDV
tara:strand:- start:74 stop:370 length:297 start_codon:yes stop_codon:yes gene_type:complete